MRVVGVQHEIAITLKIEMEHLAQHRLPTLMLLTICSVDAVAALLLTMSSTTDDEDRQGPSWSAGIHQADGRLSSTTCVMRRRASTSAASVEADEHWQHQYLFDQLQVPGASAAILTSCS